MQRISRFGLVNAYLVEEDDGLTLIDALLPRAEGAVLSAAAGRPVRRIAITHAHFDHVGALDALVAALPDAEVLISTRDARLLAGDMSLDPGEPQRKIRGTLPKVGARPTRTFSPGDRVGSLEVVGSPGHTPGHVSFLDTRDGTLYAGDAYAALGGVATGAKGSWKFLGLPAAASWHGPTALESARALRALDPARLAPGHGQVVEAPAAAMDAALARGAQRP
jgi:glyoxylase-like metal-dependent hydrolase (beta-lactamase superfamily II)